MEELSRRRELTLARVEALKKSLQQADAMVAGKACVYMTGSFGRREASSYSDLDLFILGRCEEDDRQKGGRRRLLSGLDETCVKADIIRAARDGGFPDFSGDGRYLVHHSVHDLTKTLGKPEDDAANTFTARLLLLLESFPLLGEAVYYDAIESVIQSYWRDHDDHKDEFMPAFLVNDILRLWRTFCVNYEAYTEREPETSKAKGKVRNYKLKYSRMLTCYSAVLYLLMLFEEKGTVTPQDAMGMVKYTPIERLHWLSTREKGKSLTSTVDNLATAYDHFLRITKVDEEAQIALFMNKDTARSFMSEAYEFGDLMFKAIVEIGSGGRFHRLLVV